MSTPKCIACNIRPAVTMCGQGPYFCTQRCASEWGLKHYDADGADKWCTYCDEWAGFNHWATMEVRGEGTAPSKQCKEEIDD